MDFLSSESLEKRMTKGKVSCFWIQLEPCFALREKKSLGDGLEISLNSLVLRDPVGSFFTKSCLDSLVYFHNQLLHLCCPCVTWLVLVM